MEAGLDHAPGGLSIYGIAHYMKYLRHNRINVLRITFNHGETSPSGAPGMPRCPSPRPTVAHWFRLSERCASQPRCWPTSPSQSTGAPISRPSSAACHSWRP